MNLRIRKNSLGDLLDLLLNSGSKTLCKTKQINSWPEYLHGVHISRYIFSCPDPCISVMFISKEQLEHTQGNKMIAVPQPTPGKKVFCLEARNYYFQSDMLKFMQTSACCSNSEPQFLGSKFQGRLLFSGCIPLSYTKRLLLKDITCSQKM